MAPPSFPKSAVIRLVAAVVLIASTYYTWTHFSVSARMTKFMPTGRDQELSAITAEFSDSSLTRSMILNVKSAAPGASDEETRAATRRFADELSRSGAFSWVESGPEAGTERAFFDLYFPRRYFFFSEDPARAVAQLDSDGISRRVAELKNQLAQPSAVLLRNFATRDPWGSFSALLERLQDSRPKELSVVDGQLMTHDGHGVLFAGFETSAFDSDAQASVLRALTDVEARVESELGELTVESTGINRFATDAESRIKEDVNRVSTLATVATLVLFFLFFPSLPYFLVTLVPLLGGSVVAAAASLYVFGELHAITVAFGSALLGVAIDYPTHYLTHYTHSNTATPEDAMTAVRPALWLGALTTVVGLTGLGWTTFPGFRELALFSGVGVAAALLLTLFVLPGITPKRRKSRLVEALAGAFGAFVIGLGRYRKRLVLLPVLAVAAIVTALPRLEWQDSMLDLTSKNDALFAEDRRIRERTSAMENGQFVLALGTTLEEALSKNDAAAGALKEAVSAGEVAEFQSLHSLLWSERLQRENQAALLSRSGLAAETLAALEAQGFESAAFQAFLDDLKSATPLRYEDLARSPLRSLVRSFVAEKDGKVAVLSFVRDVKDPAALAARLSRLPDVHYFDQARLLDEAYVAFRSRTVELVIAGALLVFLVLCFSYRSLRFASAAFLPAALGSLGALSVLVHLGTPLNLFHVLIAILVLSMGEDYGVFLVETLRNPELRADLGSSLAGVTLAASSTIVSFGALAFSEEPSLRSIGQTAGLGILGCFVLAPAALVLAGKTEGRERPS